MTPAEHRREVAAVRASLLLMPTRAARHGVYANRPVVEHVVVPPIAPVHVYVLPVVRPL